MVHNRYENCVRVTLKADCEEAARQLSLSDTVASETESGPPYCFFHNGVYGEELWFNNDVEAVSPCTSSDACICKGKEVSVIIF